MPKIRKILVPVDFSDDSTAALRLAVEFAKGFGADIHLLHCYQDFVGDLSIYDLTAPEDFYHELHRAAGAKLDQLRSELKDEGVHMTTEVCGSLPSEAICDSARKCHADVIVMGTRGITGLAHVILGSVAERTVRSAPCPVLTVKAEHLRE
jgi:nucleotide-binding universal stress UspA family protein